MSKVDRDRLYKDEYKKIAARLRQARQKRGLNQGRVAAMICATQSRVSKLEAGILEVGVVELQELAKIYGKSLDFFIK